MTQKKEVLSKSFTYAAEFNIVVSSNYIYTHRLYTLARIMKRNFFSTLRLNGRHYFRYIVTTLALMYRRMYIFSVFFSIPVHLGVGSSPVFMRLFVYFLYVIIHHGF